jgi:hypothetical protein
VSGSGADPVRGSGEPSGAGAAPAADGASLAACVAHLLGVPGGAVPHEAGALRDWLWARGLGLVPVADADAHVWPGAWIGLRPARDGEGLHAVVLFGVPPGVLFEPAPTREALRGGFALAPLDLARWPLPAGEPGSGVVEALVVADAASAGSRTVQTAEAVPGRGLRGDRYEAGRGTFPSGRPGSALTLVDAAVLEELAVARAAPIDHRRNVVVRGCDLNALVGCRFRLGDEVVCEGRRLCEPCAHLDRLNAGGVLRPLVHRGGLRADVLAGGAVRVGDALTPLP